MGLLAALREVLWQARAPRLVVLGIDGGGKTTLLARLRGEDVTWCVRVSRECAYVPRHVTADRTSEARSDGACPTVPRADSLTMYAASANPWPRLDPTRRLDSVGPTRGFQIKAVALAGGATVDAHDVGGALEGRPHWRAHYASANAVICESKYTFANGHDVAARHTAGRPPRRHARSTQASSTALTATAWRRRPSSSRA